ncbi:MAG: phosphotransferase [Actinotalea sp.]|nr:phosphotransferase [Actinotalea sp.]
MPLDAVADLLDEPHAYAGRSRWPELMADAVRLLPTSVRDAAHRRLDAALALPPVPPSLVHGDLAGANVLLGDDGRVVGVLDWDLAQPADPAVDAACLAWFGWAVVEAAIDPGTARRARVWHRVFPIEQVAAALDNGEDGPAVEAAVRRASAWLVRQEGAGRPSEEA